MWRSVREIDVDLAALDDVSGLDRLHALSTFWENAVYPENYRASSDWETALVPSDYGARILQELKPVLSKG